MGYGRTNSSGNGGQLKIEGSKIESGWAGEEIKAKEFVHWDIPTSPFKLGASYFKSIPVPNKPNYWFRILGARYRMNVANHGMRIYIDYVNESMNQTNVLTYALPVVTSIGLSSVASSDIYITATSPLDENHFVVAYREVEKQEATGSYSYMYTYAYAVQVFEINWDTKAVTGSSIVPISERIVTSEAFSTNDWFAITGSLCNKLEEGKKHSVIFTSYYNSDKSKVLNIIYSLNYTSALKVNKLQEVDYCIHTYSLGTYNMSINYFYSQGRTTMDSKFRWHIICYSMRYVGSSSLSCNAIYLNVTFLKGVDSIILSPITILTSFDSTVWSSIDAPNVAMYLKEENERIYIRFASAKYTMYTREAYSYILGEFNIGYDEYVPTGLTLSGILPYFNMPINIFNIETKKPEKSTSNLTSYADRLPKAAGGVFIDYDTFISFVSSYVNTAGTEGSGYFPMIIYHGNSLDAIRSNYKARYFKLSPSTSYPLFFDSYYFSDSKESDYLGIIASYSSTKIYIMFSKTSSGIRIFKSISGESTAIDGISIDNVLNVNSPVKYLTI